jgi:hypothetical protein
MKVCDFCDAAVEFLVDTMVYMSVNDSGRWKHFVAELCPKCNRKLVDAEREHREYAILKAHLPFVEKIRKSETIRKRRIYQANF